MARLRRFVFHKAYAQARQRAALCEERPVETGESPTGLVLLATAITAMVTLYGWRNRDDRIKE
jgi:hypothetical protein